MTDTREILENFKSLNLEENKNKGSGAGGKNTNLKGKNFEELTNSGNLLKDYNKFKINSAKYGYFLQKIEKKDDNEIFYTYMTQSGFKIYFKKYYDIDFFRFPDEAYIVQDKEKMDIYIIEKKEQEVDGSVETKLWSSPSLKREYEIILEDKFKESKVKYNIQFHYILCVSEFLENKFKTNIKYKILERILNESNIKVLYGNCDTYFEDLKSVINF
jgi:hypothetical protein